MISVWSKMALGVYLAVTVPALASPPNDVQNILGLSDGAVREFRLVESHVFAETIPWISEITRTFASLGESILRRRAALSPEVVPSGGEMPSFISVIDYEIRLLQKLAQAYRKGSVQFRLLSQMPGVEHIAPVFFEQIAKTSEFLSIAYDESADVLEKIVYELTELQVKTSQGLGGSREHFRKISVAIQRLILIGERVNEEVRFAEQRSAELRKKLGTQESCAPNLSATTERSSGKPDEQSE